MLLQAITVDDRAYEVEKASRSFISELIFPAGCLPSVEVISAVRARVTDLRMLDLEDITAHYAETLRRWRENFVRSGRARRAARAMTGAFDGSGSFTSPGARAAFRERRIGDVQDDARQAGLPRLRSRAEPAAGSDRILKPADAELLRRGTR